MVSVVEGLVSAETMKEEEKAVQKGKSWRGRLEKKGDRLDTGGGGGGMLKHAHIYNLLLFLLCQDTK